MIHSAYCFFVIGWLYFCLAVVGCFHWTVSLLFLLQVRATYRLCSFLLRKRNTFANLIYGHLLVGTFNLAIG